MGSQTFELERFGWVTPDRLEIEGRFVGLEVAPAAQPVLVLRGAERTHRLPAVTEAAEVTADHWHAVFAWRESPTAFDAAQLELGDDVLVDLPEPHEDGEESRPDVLDVRRGGGAERLRLQAELLSVRSELSEASARLARTEQDLARARDDLEAERASRARDAQQFRHDLQQAHMAAEQALAEVGAEADALRARAADLASANDEAERLRSRLSTIRDILDEAIGDGRG